jgi:hypothetical protein
MSGEVAQRPPRGYLGRRTAGVALVGIALVATASSTVLQVIGSDSAAGLGPLSTLPFVAVTALVVLRRPENTVGLLLAAVTFLLTTGGLAEQAKVSAQGRPLGTLAAWYGEWWWVPMLILLLVVIPLTFPDGRLLSRRWRPVLIVILCAGTTAILAAWFQARLPVGTFGHGSAGPTIANPIGWAPWPEMEEAWPGWLFFGTIFPGIALALLSLLLRFRRSRGAERQQLKWAAFGMAALGVAFIANMLAEVILGVRLPAVLEAMSAAAVPLAFGIAILRYRLYDIDRIISHSAIYLSLTVLLLGIYAVSVVTLQSVLRPVTDGSDLAIATSTLAVVVCFQPIRRRLQALVDRRFHRSRYDAQQMIAAFGARLRDEVDLDALASDLHDVVTTAIAPSHAWLWTSPGLARSARVDMADVEATPLPGPR